MTQKIEITKKNTDKTDMTKNDTQNDKQSEMTTKMTTKVTIKWQIKYFVFFNLCLPKLLLTIVEGSLPELLRFWCCQFPNLGGLLRF